MANKTMRAKTGLIVSDKTDKTVTVVIARSKEHPIYKKKYSVSKKYQAHDEKNEYKTGELVEIIECRPISRNKNFKVVRKIEK